MQCIFVFWFLYTLLSHVDKINFNGEKKNYSIAAITSILFAIHPLQVESVVWQLTLVSKNCKRYINFFYFGYIVPISRQKVAFHQVFFEISSLILY